MLFSLNVKWIVSGTIGVNGPHVLRLVEKEYTKEKGLKHGKPKMEESHVLGVTRQHNHAKNKNVQVFVENSSMGWESTGSTFTMKVVPVNSIKCNHILSIPSSLYIG